MAVADQPPFACLWFFYAATVAGGVCVGISVNRIACVASDVCFGWANLNHSELSHHAGIFVFENVAVIHIGLLGIGVI